MFIAFEHLRRARRYHPPYEAEFVKFEGSCFRSQMHLGAAAQTQVELDILRHRIPSSKILVPELLSYAHYGHNGHRINQRNESCIVSLSLCHPQHVNSRHATARLLRRLSKRCKPISAARPALSSVIIIISQNKYRTDLNCVLNLIANKENSNSFPFSSPITCQFFFSSIRKVVKASELFTREKSCRAQPIFPSRHSAAAQRICTKTNTTLNSHLLHVELPVCLQPSIHSFQASYTKPSKQCQRWRIPIPNPRRLPSAADDDLKAQAQIAAGSRSSI